MNVHGVAALANAVRQARREAGLSQQELANRSGMSRVSVARLETGTANTTLDSLLRVASVLGMRLDVSWDAAGAAQGPLPRKRPRTRRGERAARTEAVAKDTLRSAEANVKNGQAEVKKSHTNKGTREPVDLNTVLERVSRRD